MKKKLGKFWGIVYTGFLMLLAVWQPGSPETFGERRTRIIEAWQTGNYNVNVFPLEEVIHVFRYRVTTRILLFGLNFVVFMPLGAALWKWNLKNIVFPALLLPLVKEGTQFLLGAGVFDINDLLFNVAGFLVAWRSMRFLKKQKLMI